MKWRQTQTVKIKKNTRRLSRSKTGTLAGAIRQKGRTHTDYTDKEREDNKHRRVTK